MEFDNERRRIGFRDDGEYDYRSEYDYRAEFDSGDEAYSRETEGTSPRMGSGDPSSGSMQHGHAGSLHMHSKEQRWQQLMEKIRKHDKKHRTPRTKRQITEILYDNLPGPSWEQTELLVAVMQAVAMDCMSKNKQ